MPSELPSQSNLLPLPTGRDRADVVSPQERAERKQLERDLALVGRASLLLDPSRILQSLDELLDLMLAASGAEHAELFLLDRASDELILTLQRGLDSRAFGVRTRFQHATGYPGLAMQQGGTLYTTHLQDDDRFLRDAVKDAGYHAFIAMPLGPAGQPLGTLDLAWKRSDVDFDRVQRVLGWLARPIGAALLASVTVWTQQWQVRDTQLRDRFQTLTQADDVTLVRLGAGGTQDSGGCSEDSLGTECVPVRRSGPLVLADDTSEWPSGCVERCGSAQLRYCLPLQADETTRGVVRISFEGPPPSPPTRHLAASLRIAESVSVVPGSTLLTDALPNPAPPVDIKLFGAFEVSISGHPLPRSAFARKKALDLLQLLALRPGRPVTGRQLIRLLWPGVEPESGKNRLHGVVHALRKGLDGATDGAGAAWVVSGEDRYAFEPPKGSRVDLWEFRDHIARARRAAANGEPADVVADRLQKAVELYRGELFAGADDAVWFLDPRSRCREQYTDALLKLHRCRIDLGGDPGDVSLLRLALAADPLREDIHLRLIRTLFEARRRGDALVQYDTLVGVLREQLDTGPSPEARKLRRQIREAGTG